MLKTKFREINCIIVTLIMLLCAVSFTACKKEFFQNTTIELNKTYKTNNILINVSNDFELKSTEKGLNVYSEKNESLNSNHTNIICQLDYFNNPHTFNDTPLNSYMNDFSRIYIASTMLDNHKFEDSELIESNYTFTIKEKTYTKEISNIDMTLKIHKTSATSKNNNYYRFVAVGKAKNCFVGIHSTSAIDSSKLNENIEKMKKILSTISIDTEENNKQVSNFENDFGKYYVPSKYNVKTFPFNVRLPKEYQLCTTNKNDISYSIDTENYTSHLKTKNILNQNKIAVFNSSNLERHIAKYGNNKLAFYTKTLSFSSLTPLIYDFYFILDNNNLYSCVLSVELGINTKDFSQRGFETYFLETMLNCLSSLSL